MNPSRSLRQSGAAARTAAALIVLAGFVPVVLAAQTTARTAIEAYEPHPEAKKAISVLKSPYCPGLMLEVCSSYPGALLRDSLQTMAEEGWSADSLVAWTLARHGDTLLALPPVSGRGLVAWAGPPIAFALGLGLVALFLRAVMARRVAVAGASEELSEQDEAALQEALRELDESEEPVF